MGKAVLSWVNHVDVSGAVLSASEETGDFAAANLARPIVGERWRTTSLTGWAQVDFGADKTVGVLALRFPRDTAFPTVGSVSHALDADGGTPGAGAAYSQTVSIGAVEGYGYHQHVLAAAVTARYWRFTFSGVSGVSFIDVGRAWAGEAFRPERNWSYGLEDTWLDLSLSVENAKSGAAFHEERARRRQLSVPFNFGATADADSLRELARIAGLGNQVLVSLDPDGASPNEHVVIGTRARANPIRRARFALHVHQLLLREAL